jgi:hypothetical protein
MLFYHYLQINLIWNYHHNGLGCFSIYHDHEEYLIWNHPRILIDLQILIYLCHSSNRLPISLSRYRLLLTLHIHIFYPDSTLLYRSVHQSSRRLPLPTSILEPFVPHTSDYPERLKYLHHDRYYQAILPYK